MLDRLTQSLPEPYAHSPDRLPALEVSYDGAGCWAEVRDDTLRLAAAGGTGADQVIELRGLMLAPDPRNPRANLIDTLNNLPGYQAAIIPTFVDALALHGLPVTAVGAWALVETSQNLSLRTILDVGQDALFHLLRPIAAALRDLVDEIELITLRSQIDRATSVWLDDWGDLYGVDRQNGETDDDYRNRIVLELIAPRANNRAMEVIIAQVWKAYQVAVIDDMTPATDADIAAQQAGHPWARLNPYNFFVAMDLSDQHGFDGNLAGLTEIVTRIKPWGTGWEPLLRGHSRDTGFLPRDPGPWLDILRWLENYPWNTLSEQSKAILSDVRIESLYGLEQYLLTIRPPHPLGTPWVESPDNLIDDENQGRRTIGGEGLEGSTVVVGYDGTITAITGGVGAPGGYTVTETETGGSTVTYSLMASVAVTVGQTVHAGDTLGTSLGDQHYQEVVVPNGSGSPVLHHVLVHDGHSPRLSVTIGPGHGFLPWVITIGEDWYDVLEILTLIENATFGSEGSWSQFEHFLAEQASLPTDAMLGNLIGVAPENAQLPSHFFRASDPAARSIGPVGSTGPLWKTIAPAPAAGDDVRFTTEHWVDFVAGVVTAGG